jgi:hypothetical protein
MTTNRVPYATERTCCDEPGDVTAYLSEAEARGLSQIRVRCVVCGTIHLASKSTYNGDDDA